MPEPLLLEPEITVLAGRWRVGSPIGAGGMGSVYRATDITTGRVVALKVMSEQLAEDAEQLARFEREAQLLSKFEHPSLVPLIAVSRHEGVPFIVLKYLEGKTLGQLLKERTRFAVRQLLPLLQQLCSAVDYLHARGVVHRDLKPRNIVVDERDHLTLLDFGVSRHLGSKTRLTQPGMLVGTPMYMAPEQILTDDAGPAADIYALALMTWELLVGVHPFEDTKGVLVISRQIGEVPLEASLKNPAVPEPVARVLARSLQKDPEARHPTATAFYEDLITAFGTDRTDASQRNLPKTVEDARPPVHVPESAQKSLLLPVAVGVVLLVIIGLLAWRIF